VDLIGDVRGNFVAPLLLLFRFAGSMIIGVVFFDVLVTISFRIGWFESGLESG
jgi:hypothetical protein